jgi:hypothetical protein
MKVKAAVEVIPKKEIVVCSGLVFELPRTECYNSTNPETIIRRLSRHCLNYCQVVTPTKDGDIVQEHLIINELVGGVLNGMELEEVNGSLKLYANFRPCGPLGNKVNEFIQSHGYVKLKPRLHYIDSKVAMISAIDIDLSKPSENH